MIGGRFVAASVVVAAVAAGGVAGAVVGIPGISSASNSSSSSNATPQANAAPNGGRHTRGFPGPSLGAGKDILDAAAKTLKLTTTDLLAKLSDGKTTIADVAKQQNVDVQTVIGAMTAVAKDDISKLVNNPLPMPFGGDGKGRGHDGMPHLGLRGGRASLDAVAKALGISPEDLRAALAKGQSVADIAKSKNININTLIDTLVNDATSKIDAAVKAGDLSQDQATKMKSNLRDRITKAVNNTHSDGGGRFGRGKRSGMHGFGRGPEGAATPAMPMPSL